jgi:hypothetical protein
MNPEITQRIKRFMSDKATNEAIFSAIQKTFLKAKPSEDISLKAARFIALELLTEAWRDLNHIRNTDTTPTESSNVGL